MKATNYIVFLLSCLLGTTASGQNIEFVENKGQWGFWNETWTEASFGYESENAARLAVEALLG